MATCQLGETSDVASDIPGFNRLGITANSDGTHATVVCNDLEVIPILPVFLLLTHL